MPRVKEFKYLESTVKQKGSCKREIRRSVQTGWNGWRKVSGVICHRRLPARVKEKVYSSVVRPAMVYGLETGGCHKETSGRDGSCKDENVRFALGVREKTRLETSTSRIQLM